MFFHLFLQAAISNGCTSVLSDDDLTLTLTCPRDEITKPDSYSKKIKKLIIYAGANSYVVDSAFEGFGSSALETVQLPEGLKQLDSYAFYENPNLKTINLPSTLAVIGVAVFTRCALTKVTLPNSLERIEDAAFKETPIESINFNVQQLTSVGWAAFQDCVNLKTVTLKGIEFGVECFMGCYELQTITGLELITSIP